MAWTLNVVNVNVMMIQCDICGFFDVILCRQRDRFGHKVRLLDVRHEKRPITCSSNCVINMHGAQRTLMQPIVCYSSCCIRFKTINIHVDCFEVPPNRPVYSSQKMHLTLKGQYWDNRYEFRRSRMHQMPLPTIFSHFHRIVRPTRVRGVHGELNELNNWRAKLSKVSSSMA